jgi:DNA repair exonuclease SbcCD ATPase subunit
MSQISELERRIKSALERIASAAESASAAPKSTAAGPPADTVDGEAALREALEAERGANAQLTERVRAIKEKQETMVSQIERKLARATAQLDVQGLELQRLKRANAQLAEANRRLIAAAETGGGTAGAAQKALQAELESLRAARRAEMAELEEIMGELRPLVGEEQAHG